MLSLPSDKIGPLRRDSLDVYLLGLVDFESCVALQELILREIADRDDCFGVVLVCEHLPLLTIGREGSHAHISAEVEEFASREISTRWINRGGGCLVHSPGQIAFYPVLPLRRIGMGLTEYRHALEETLLRVSGELRISAVRSSGMPGIVGRTGQLAYIGAAVKSWISYQGMYLNVRPRLDWLRLVDSSAGGERASSLEVERMSRLEMHTVRESLIRNFVQVSGYRQFFVHTGHPLLHPVRRKFVHAGNC